MSESIEYRCFIFDISLSTSDRNLEDLFDKFGHLLEAKVSVNKVSWRSRAFGYVTFEKKKAMEEAIDGMNGKKIDGRTITVEKAQPCQCYTRGHDSDHSRDRYHFRDRGWDRDGRRDYGGGRGSGGGECFKCGKPRQFAKECGDGGGRGGKYGGSDDRYSSGNSSNDGGRYGPSRNGDGSGGRNRDYGGHGGGDRRDRSGPYESRSAGGSRS